MKIYSNNTVQLFDFIASKKIEAILLHGPNYGLSNFIHQQIAKKFDMIKTSVSFKTDGLTTLSGKAYMNNFFGKKEIIRVDNFANTVDKTTKEFLTSGDFSNFICFVAQDSLPPSGLRKFFEESDKLAAIACYHDDANTISSIISKKVRSLGKHIDEDALFYIKNHIEGDRMLLANELKKILLYCTDKNTITLNDVTACLGGQLLANGDEMCLYFAGNQYDKFLAEVKALKEQSVNEVLMIRALLRFYMNLYTVLSYREDGMSLDMAIKKLTPPMFFKLVPRFKAVSNKYSSVDAKNMIKLLLEAEIEYKSNHHAFDLFMFLTQQDYSNSING